MCRGSNLYGGKNGSYADIYKYDDLHSCPTYVFRRNIASDDMTVDFYSGLESYATFSFVLNTLGTATYCLRYIYFQIDSVYVRNQLFMTLMKIRRYTTNFELSRCFSLSEASVKHIVNTWILFMPSQWREANIWPPDNLVRYFAPTDFKAVERSKYLASW